MRGPFKSQRSFYQYACRQLRPLFPKLPARSQYNRSVQAALPIITAVSQHLVAILRSPADVYQVLDTLGGQVRNVKRRGGGWLAGLVQIGCCNRLGWYEGFNVLHNFCIWLNIKLGRKPLTFADLMEW